MQARYRVQWLRRMRGLLFLAALSLCALPLLSACSDEGVVASRVKKDSVDVRTAKVTVTGATVSLSLPGRVVAVREAQIRPRVSGIIQKRFFEQGQTVHRGQPLYEIEPERYASRVKAAKAEVERAAIALEIAEHDYERYQTLREQDAISEEELEDRRLTYVLNQATLQSAQSALDEAELDLEYTKVLSPLDGSVGISHAPVGSLVTAEQSDPLTTVVNLDEVFIDVNLNARQWLNLRRMRLFGTLTTSVHTSEVMLSVEGVPLEQKGHLISDEPTVEESTGTVTLRAIITNDHHFLMPGMTVSAQLMLGVNPLAKIIPVRAVQRDPKGHTYVFVVSSDNRVERRRVTLGMLTEQGFEVAEGLEEGEEIVVEGLTLLKDGSPVRIVNLVEEEGDV